MKPRLNGKCLILRRTTCIILVEHGETHFTCDVERGERIDESIDE